MSIDRPEVHITNTYLANMQAAASRRNRPYPYLPNTTINEILKFEESSAPQGVIPRCNYWAIGREGTVNKEISGRTAVSPTYHSIKDTGLFEFMPFARRLKENDLSFNERAKYAGRVEEEPDEEGKVWINYWLKRIPEPIEPLGLKKVTITDGVLEEDVFYPQSADMHPKKPILKPDGVNEVYSEFITTSDKIVCSLDRDEIEEVINAAFGYFGSIDLATITELAIVQGVDKEVTRVDANGQPFTFNECVGAQIATHCCKANGSLLGEEKFEMVFDSAVTDAMAIG